MQVLSEFTWNSKINNAVSPGRGILTSRPGQAGLEEPYSHAGLRDWQATFIANQILVFTLLKLSIGTVPFSFLSNENASTAGPIIMASLLLLFLCMIVTSQGAPSKDTAVLNLIVETTSSAANRITSSKLFMFGIVKNIN